MSPNPFNYMVQTPEVYAGEVMGKLTALGVTVTNVETTEGVWRISAESQSDIRNEFTPWFLKVTNDLGIIEMHDSV